MPKISPFDKHHHRYESWFANHNAAYCSELLAVQALLPRFGFGLEIGVGTGRFAAPLGVCVGLDPSAAMLEYARARGIQVVQGIAEQLPFAANSFDFALSVATICFLDDVRAMLHEARRVIKPDGCLVLGFIDRGSSMGQEYLNQQTDNVFYREATFYTAEEVEKMLRESGFTSMEWVQTLSRPVREIVEVEPFCAGHGKNAFVVVKAGGVPYAQDAGAGKNDDMFGKLADFSADWLYWRTPEGEMRYISPAAGDVTGYSVEELSDFPDIWTAIIHPDDQGEWFCHVHEADNQGRTKPIEFRVVTKQGAIRWISHLCRPIYNGDGVFMGISGSNRDITQRKEAEDRLRHLSTHDDLTGLFNRAYFETELERLAGGRQFPISVVMADVDGLKEVNDHHGHAAGDRLLRQAATFLLDLFRAEDVVARIGGDEFAVLLPGADNHIVGELLNRIAISQEIVNCSGSECSVSLSLGAATVATGDELLNALKLADQRMYQDKSSKKHR